MAAPFKMDFSEGGMLKDIWDTPQVLRKMIKQEPGARLPDLKKKLSASHKCAGRTPLEVMAACAPASAGSFQNKFTIIGSGTSWHAALIGEYLIESIARIPVEVQYASEFRTRPLLFRPGDVLVVVSSSGETWESVESLKAVQGLASEDAPDITVAFVNEAGSSIARSCDALVDVGAGPEVGVTSTKTLNATILSFVLLALELAEARGTLQQSEQEEIAKQLGMLPDHVQSVLDQECSCLLDGPQATDGTGSRSLAKASIGDCRLWDMSCQNALAGNFMFLGRGVNFPVALEGALKCKELAYIHAEGYPAAEMKHGPIALIDQFMPVVVIAPRSDPTYEKIKASIEEVKTRGGAIISITEFGNDELDRLSDLVIHVPLTHEYLMPMVALIPLQLQAYMMGTLRGNEVDCPRGLVKSCTAAGKGGYVGAN